MDKTSDKVEVKLERKYREKNKDDDCYEITSITCIVRKDCETQTDNLISNIKNEQNQINDENYSFKPWNILLSDIERTMFESKTIPYNFEFRLQLEFVCFGTLKFIGGTVVFRSNKGISLQTKDGENQLTITIGKEDIVYCAVFCQNKINMLFLHPTTNFTILFRDKLNAILRPNVICFDPNSQDECCRRIVIVSKNKVYPKLPSHIYDYFEHLKTERNCQLDFLKLDKAKDLTKISLGKKFFKVFLRKLFLKFSKAFD